MSTRSVSPSQVPGDTCGDTERRLASLRCRAVPPTVGPLTAEHVDAAGALLAARHAVEREHCPLLPAGPSDPAVAASIVAGTLRFCDGVAAVDDGRARRLPGRLRTGHRPDDADGPLLAGPRLGDARPGPRRRCRHRSVPGLRRPLRRPRSGATGGRHHRPRRPRADPHAGGGGGMGRARVRSGQQRRRARPGADRPADATRRRGPHRRARRPRRRRPPRRRGGRVPCRQSDLPPVPARSDRKPRCAPSWPSSWRATTTPSSSPGAGASTLACCRSDRRSARRCTSPTARPTSARRPSSPTSAAAASEPRSSRPRSTGARERGHRAACLHFSTANRSSSSFWPGDRVRAGDGPPPAPPRRAHPRRPAVTGQPTWGATSVMNASIAARRPATPPGATGSRRMWSTPIADHAPIVSTILAFEPPIDLLAVICSPGSR